MTEQTTTLREKYGYERAMFIAAWVAVALNKRIRQGLVDGIVCDEEASMDVVLSGFAAGHQEPTDDEISNAVRAMRAANPSLSLTTKGLAFSDFHLMTRGAGHG